MPTIPDLYDAPPKANLVLAKGEDVDVDFVYKPMVVDLAGEPVLDGNGNPTYEVEDYPAGSTVTFCKATSCALLEPLPIGRWA